MQTDNYAETGPAGGRILAILGFHKVGEPPPLGWETWYYIPDAKFVGYLRYLRENGWEVIDLATFLLGLDAPETLPARAALLTFDDGYRSIMDCALPRLIEFSYPGVVFVPTAFIGGRNLFDADTHEPEEVICGWDDLRELERRGISVQSHGVSHRSFSDLTTAEQRQELRRSKEVLEDGLGKPVAVFAYPYGDAGVDHGVSQQLLQQCGYGAACLYGGGPSRFPPADRFRLPRLALGSDSDLRAELPP